MCRTKHEGGPLRSHVPVASSACLLTGSPFLHVMQSESPVGLSLKPHVAHGE